MKIQLWREFLDPYDLAVKELITKFEHLKYEHKARGLYCPIEESFRTCKVGIQYSG